MYVVLPFYVFEGVEEYERACCIRGYHGLKVLTAPLAKALVHDNILHCLVCNGDYLHWLTC